MNATETLLREGIAANPDDFSFRLELAEKLAARKADDEIAVLFGESAVPNSAAEMHRCLELAAQCGLGDDAMNSFVARYVAEHPADAWGHHVYALALSRIGDEGQARRHYEAARKLDPDTRDVELEAVLAAAEEGQVLAPRPMTAPMKSRAAASEASNEAVSAGISADREAPVAQASLEEAGDPQIAAGDESLAVPAPRSLVAPDPQDASGSEPAPALEEPQYGEHIDEGGEGGERGLMVANGEMIHAKDKQPDTREKISALTVALAVNIGLVLLASLYAIAGPPKQPPAVVAAHVADLDSEDIEDMQVEKKIRQAPAQSASAQVQVMTVSGASAVSIPEIEVDTDSFEPVGVGDSFGMSMSFDSAEDGGMVSFFGARTTSKKVVFVVDYSASMRGDKDELMRKELKKSIEALPPSVEYALILFSGPAWYAGQEHEAKGDPKDEWETDYVRDGSKKWKWYGGWDESKRIKKGDRALVFHYEDEDPDKLPAGEYKKASRSNIRRTLRDIEKTPLSIGTDWRSPLMMAMNMEPDTIFFMTDGSIPNSNPKQNAKMISDLVKYNRGKSRAKINTVCMMVLNAKKELESLAKETRGEFSLVKQDGTVVRGKDL